MATSFDEIVGSKLVGGNDESHSAYLTIKSTQQCRVFSSEKIESRIKAMQPAGISLRSKHTERIQPIGSGTE